MLTVSSARRRLKSLGRDWSVPVLESRLLLTPVLLDSSPGPNGTSNLTLTGTSGDDGIGVFQVSPTEVYVFATLPGVTLSLNGGPEQQFFMFTGINDLSFDLGAGNDSVVITNLTADDVTIEDGIIPGEQGFYIIQSAQGPVELDTIEAEFSGGAMAVILQSAVQLEIDQLKVRADNTDSLVVQVVTNGGSIVVNDDVVIRSSGAQSVDQVLIATDAQQLSPSSSIDLNGTLKVMLGGGADRFKMSGNVSASRQVQISTGSGDDTVDITLGQSFFPVSMTFQQAVTIETGSGLDWISVIAQPSQSRVEFKSHVVMSTGDQNDIVQIFGAEFEKSFIADGGRSDAVPSLFGAADVFSLGNTEVLGLTSISTQGVANVYLFAVNSALQPMRFHGPAFFTLGSGFVDASFVFDPDSRITFDGLQVYVGINEPIAVRYGSAVVANLRKRLLFNAFMQ